MRKLLNIIKKDLLLLIRDKLGLLTLFVLPAFLVLVVTSIAAGQNDARKNISLLLISHGADKTSAAIIKALNESDEFKITRYHSSIAMAKQSVNQGKYNGIIYIPYQTDLTQPYRVDIYLDPSMETSIKDSIQLALDVILSKVVLAKANYILGKIKEDLVQENIDLSTRTTATGVDEAPNISEQNVPAWSIFGMFFIVMSLAGQMVHEKLDGVSQRLQLMPVNNYLLLLGKTVTFIILNLIQLLFIIAIGIYLLPYVGAPVLNVHDKMSVILIAGLFTSIAAIGFGLFLGTLSTSIHQVNAVCPFLIVIIAAVSGIFTPISLMPETFKTIGQFSPIYWAQSSFLDIFTKNATLQDITPNLAKLFGFYILMMVLIKVAQVTRRS